ncbi:slowpoke binding protein isoform 2-T7 [Glossina fuscipes fuscipes]
MQDITSEIPPLQPVCSEEVIFNCRQQQQQQQQQQKQPQQQTPTTAATSIFKERQHQQQPLQPLNTQKTKIITRSQSSKVIQDLQHNHNQRSWHQLKQQQSLPTPLHANNGGNSIPNGHNHPKSVSILVYKTLNTVFKSSRKIIVRVCEVASVRKSFTMFKFNKAAQQSRADARANACTGHDQFVRPPVSDKKAKHIIKKLNKQNGLKRSNSAIEFDVSALTAANRRNLYCRPNIKYQYSALDSGNGIVERSPRERAQRERALNATQEWIQNSNGRYEVLAHLDEIGSRHGKHWFLVTDATVRTDRLLTLLSLPPDCVAFEDLPPSENPRGMLMELLGSLHHPYIYPVLDLGFLHTSSGNYACLVTPFNSRGSLKDLIFKAQWNEPWSRKYTRKPNGLPVTQVQRLGRQILEALLFLKERGFPLHGHLHSGNVILQNGAARLSGLENGLLGLSSRINAIMWSRSVADIENVDIICFGHLLYEMCMGQEMTTPKPSMRVLEMEMEHYPQILDVLGLIFEPPNGACPTVEDLVLCDLFRSIDLRELRGPCFNTIKPSLSRSTLNLLQAVKKRQCASLGNSLSETSSPCTPPSTPRDHRAGISRTMESFDCISSDSEEGLLDEIVVGCNYHQQQLQRMQIYQKHQQSHHKRASSSSQHHHHHSYPYLAQKSPYDTMESPIHYCDNTTQLEDNHVSVYQEATEPKNERGTEKQHEQEQSQQIAIQEQQPQQTMTRCSSSTSSSLNLKLSGSGGAAGMGDSICSSESSITATTIISHEETENVPQIPPQQQHQPQSSQQPTTLIVDRIEENEKENIKPKENLTLGGLNSTTAQPSGNSHPSALTAAVVSFNHQLTADICNFKNSKSRRLEYSLKCLKYGRSNPSQDSAFGSLTDNDLSTGSSSFRLSSFQSISSPIDEGVEDIIIATTTAGHETCLELTTLPRGMASQDSAISSPCRESSPSNFLNIEEGSCSGASSSSGSTGNLRPQHFPVSLSPKILVTATTNSSNSSLSSNTCAPTSNQQQQQQQQFDPPKILVNDQNSIYTTSPSKRSGTIEVFSQKYRVSSFEDMSPNKRSSSSDKQHLKNVNRLAFRSLEEERRIDNAFMPITDRTHSDNRVNVQSEKYKKLTHASFRISKTSSQVIPHDISPGQVTTSSPGSSTTLAGSGISLEMQRPATASGSSNSRQTIWRDSKFYRKNRIAKSNDSLLESSPNHSARLSPSSLRDNHYDSSSSYCSRSHSRQSLNRGGSINEILGSNQTLGPEITVTTSFCNNSSVNNRRYCSSKSEDLADSSDYLRVMDTRKSYSERHLVTLTTLKQTAINNTMPLNSNDPCCLSEDEMSFNDDNNACGGQANVPAQAIPSQSSQYHKQQRHQRHYQLQPSKTQYAKYNQEQQQMGQQHAKQSYKKRPHPNQLSWSSCSINRLKTTNIKTTSLATLPCQQNSTSPAGSTYNINQQLSQLSSTAVASSSLQKPITSSTPLLILDTTRSPKRSQSRNAVFKTLDNTTDTSTSDNSNPNSVNITLSEENSSPDESPSRRTLSGIELAKIFSMDDGAGCSSCCSEEKTPLLDSVEMSPISPTEPGNEEKDKENGEKQEKRSQRSEKM